MSRVVQLCSAIRTTTTIRRTSPTFLLVFEVLCAHEVRIMISYWTFCIRTKPVLSVAHSVSRTRATAHIQIQYECAYLTHTKEGEMLSISLFFDRSLVSRNEISI